MLFHRYCMWVIGSSLGAGSTGGLHLVSYNRAHCHRSTWSMSRVYPHISPLQNHLVSGFNCQFIKCHAWFCKSYSANALLSGADKYIFCSPELKAQEKFRNHFSGVRLSVCSSVCLSVCKFCHIFHFISRAARPILTKFDTKHHLAKKM